MGRDVFQIVQFLGPSWDHLGPSWAILGPTFGLASVIFLWFFIDLRFAVLRQSNDVVFDDILTVNDGLEPLQGLSAGPAGRADWPGLAPSWAPASASKS